MVLAQLLATMNMSACYAPIYGRLSSKREGTDQAMFMVPNWPSSTYEFQTTVEDMLGQEV